MRKNVYSYSILMSVYKNDNPVFFEESLRSIISQTLPSNNVVIIKDGKLTKELDDVLYKFQKENGNISIYGYEENKGLGYALNFGLKYCINDIVLRMDADDICDLRRAEIQVPQFIRDNVDISSTTVALFENNVKNILGYRKLPTNEKDILKFSKTRSPFNHPSAIFKKSSVLKAGCYKDLLYKEDYYLWIRMIQNGCKFNNVDIPLVYMRVNSDTFFRRKNKTAYKNSLFLNRYMLRTKYISIFTYFKNAFIYFFRQHLPNTLSSKITKSLWK